MKKVLLVLSLMLGLATLSFAQPKAVGIRVGRGVLLSYEHNLPSANFFEAELGLDSYDGKDLCMDGVYNFMIISKDFGSDGTFGFYGGPGGSIAVDDDDDDDDDDNVYVGFLGNLGVEYTFNIPLQISLDIRPRVMFGNGGVWSDGILSFGVGIRYAF